MAIEYSKTVKGTCYEIRTAGQSVRLYSNGVFHSQWNPNAVLGGNLWDLFILPLLFLERPHSLTTPATEFAAARFDAAVLGVGGGAVINQLMAVAPNCCIHGVDLDKMHLQLAQRFFRVPKDRVELTNANALDWVVAAAKRGQMYRYVIDDLFCESDTLRGEAVRAIDCDARWLGDLLKITAHDGLLVINFESMQQWQQARKIAMNKGWVREVYCFQKPGYYNAIGVFSRMPISKGASKQKLLLQLENLGVMTAAKRRKVSDFTLKRARR